MTWRTSPYFPYPPRLFLFTKIFPASRRLGPEGLARSDYVGVVSWRGLRVGGSDCGWEEWEGGVMRLSLLGRCLL